MHYFSHCWVYFIGAIRGIFKMEKEKNCQLFVVYSVRSNCTWELPESNRQAWRIIMLLFESQKKAIYVLSSYMLQHHNYFLYIKSPVQFDHGTTNVFWLLTTIDQNIKFIIIRLFALPFILCHFHPPILIFNYTNSISQITIMLILFLYSFSIIIQQIL